MFLCLQVTHIEISTELNRHTFNTFVYVCVCACVFCSLQVQTYEGRVAELNAQLTRAQQWGQQQLAALEEREEEVVALKVEVASIRENYHATLAQVRHAVSARVSRTRGVLISTQTSV